MCLKFKNLTREIANLKKKLLLMRTENITNKDRSNGFKFKTSFAQDKLTKINDGHQSNKLIDFSKFLRRSAK